MPRILMCDPRHYDVFYQINPWMTLQNPVKNTLAQTQWRFLTETLARCGAAIELIAPQPGWPDMVFTANAGLVYKKRFYPAYFRYPERQGERPYFIEWFTQAGYDIINSGLATPFYFEGAGDALFAGKRLFAAYGFRSQREVYMEIGKLADISLIYCELIDPYFYHLDTCFCPLNDKQALIWPGAFTKETFQRINREIELLTVPETDARKFACNAVVLNDQVIIPSGCDATAKLLEQKGFTVHQCDMSEYIKAGGACKCLTLIIE